MVHPFQVAQALDVADATLDQAALEVTPATPGAAPVDVTVADGIVNVVYVKSVVASSPLLVSQFKLK